MNYYQHLLQPVSSDSPCGENLDYDPAFLLLQAKLQPRLGAEYGDFIEVADPVNWAEIERECHALLAKSRDIRLIVTLMRCRLRVVGLAAIAEGLQILQVLLKQWPDDLYPQLMDEGEFDPLLRANAFNELEDSSGLISDLRQHMLPKAVGVQCTIKDFERAFAVPRDDAALPEATARAIQNEWRNQALSEMATLGVAESTLAELSCQLQESLGEDMPAFSSLKRILALFSNVAPTAQVTERTNVSTQIPVQAKKEQSVSGTAEESDAVTTAQEDSSAVVVQNQTITHRAQALACLKDVQSWFVATEPGSPIILLLEFAIKTSGKSFTELMHLLPVDIVSHLNSTGRE